MVTRLDYVFAYKTNMCALLTIAYTSEMIDESI